MVVGFHPFKKIRCEANILLAMHRRIKDINGEYFHKTSNKKGFLFAESLLI
jgi:hypothetical protein